MNIIPKPRRTVVTGGTAELSKIHWIFGERTDERVINEAYSICPDSSDGFPVTIAAGEGSSEAYEMNITPNGAELSSLGAPGAFYALQTLKQLRRGGSVECGKISDAPDMKYRGFYHDVTRGRVPKLDTLKSLADKMAELKLNSLQLYIEHTFEFSEYEFCRDELGYLTKEEIRELDEYCNSKFIELVPSVSSFGHLYHLLQSDKYRHLSELPDYQPTRHYWAERMMHHTINPELDESFELIKSMLDQYMEVSRSDKFNICCDETFDLGTGVNKGKNKAELYVNFIKKIVGYLTSRGKTVMMWGDIILQHPEYINELPDNVIFLNWNYSPAPGAEQFEKIHAHNRAQIVCPGTSAWNSFSEDVAAEEGNISALAEYAYKYGAEGLLNTNWGDYGNLASITMASYGLALGAAVSWRKGEKPSAQLRRDVSELMFGNSDTVELIAQISEIKRVLNWAKAVLKSGDAISEAEYRSAASTLSRIHDAAAGLCYCCDTVRSEVLSAIEGFEIIAAMCARVDGAEYALELDVDKWCEEYRRLWLLKNKPSELEEIIRVIKEGLK